MAKCWIYNELADIPDEFIVIEKQESMFEDLQRILIRKNWITKEDIIQDEESNKNENEENRRLAKC